MDPLMLQPTWTTVMAIDLCDGRKYFLEPQSFVHRTTSFGNNQQVRRAFAVQERYFGRHATKADSVKAWVLFVKQQLHNVYSQHTGLRRNSFTLPSKLHFWVREQLATSSLPSQGSRQQPACCLKDVLCNRGMLVVLQLPTSRLPPQGSRHVILK